MSHYFRFNQTLLAFLGVVRCCLNFLLPWQGQARENKRAMLEYVHDNYPGARIVSQNYESTKFNPWSASIDSITLKWNGVEFSLLAEDGSLIRDNYWHGVGKKLVYEKCLNPFFYNRKIDYRYELTAFGLEKFLMENSNNDILKFNGEFTIIIYPKYKLGKPHPKDLGWAYDFYRYWKDNVNLSRYTVRIIYPEETYILEFTDKSAFSSEDEFYSAVKEF